MRLFPYHCTMSPRVLLIDGYDFFFYSREENRMHVHVEKGENEAKVWLEPTIELAYSHGFTTKEIKLIHQTVEMYEQIINDKWNSHFCNKKQC